MSWAGSREYVERFWWRFLVWISGLVSEFIVNLGGEWGCRDSWCSGIVFHNKPSSSLLLPPAFHTSNVWGPACHTRQAKKFRFVDDEQSILVHAVEWRDRSKDGWQCADGKDGVTEFIRAVATISPPSPTHCRQRIQSHLLNWCSSFEGQGLPWDQAPCRLTATKKKSQLKIFDVRLGDDGVSRGEAFLAPVYPPCPGLRRPHLGSAGADGSRAGSNISTLGASGGGLRGRHCPGAVSWGRATLAASGR